MMQIIAYAPADKATDAPPMRKLCVLMLMFGAPGIAMLRNDATKRHLDKAHYREQITAQVRTDDKSNNFS